MRGPGLDFRTLEPATPAAAIVDIEVNKKTGKITVKHVYAAIAPGLVVNPGRVADQVIGTAVMGTSQALLEEVKFDKSNVTSLDWVSYPTLRFKDHPNVTPIVIQRLDARARRGQTRNRSQRSSPRSRTRSSTRPACAYARPR